ncbi:hypothetical protein HYX08_02115 [Candidatus Woesearchaeota archaeon]|nr:hypothetical protein [Candidatus Woesearchaeota archaeon]
MSEQKQVLYDLRTSYDGPFIVEEFYAEVENWIRENGLEKEPKKKMEHVTKNGKKIEWVIEAHRHIDELHYGVVILRALLDNVKETVVKKNGKKIRINTGNALISIDGFIQSHIHGSFFQVKPLYYLMRDLIDKYVYHFWWAKNDGIVISECNDLFKRLRAYFNLQKYKYQ